MSPSDWAAWAAVMMTLLGILATIAGVWWQMKKQWLLHSATMVTDLLEQFNSEAFEKRRKRFIELLLRHRNGEEITLRGNYGFGVLGFFEHIGHLVRRGALDEAMIWNKFGWEIICYYVLVTSGKNLIMELRTTENNPTEYIELQWLYRRMILAYQRHGHSTLIEGAEPAWMAAFIEQESHVAETNLLPQEAT